MADQRFTATEREAIWLAHEKKCGYTRELIDVSSFHIDHVLPEKLADSPDELNRTKAQLGLDDKFELTGFENLLPCKPGINLQKGSVILEPAPIHYFLALAASKKALVQGHLARIEQRKNRGRALILLQQCLERGELSPDEVVRILEEYVDQPAEIFKLIEGMKFADSEVHTVAKADIAELRNRPIRLGRNDDIDGVTLTNDADEQIHVRSCTEYDAAIEAGYFALTTFDIKMATFFEHQCGLLKALEAASTPNVSHIADPRVGIVDLHLLPFSLFPYMGEEPESSDTNPTYQSKIADGTLVVRRITHNLLVIEEHEGMGQQLIEVVRADFNGDGVEDILLFEYCYATHGTLGYGGIRVLTLKDSTSRFEELTL
ncbi:MAG: hypothetical protein JW943_03165 [Deltaproteobacteria bacterium]|nr:hypothetical protein [Deltaproteobacteria bacterium]